MSTYVINFTDINLTPISIEESGIDETSVDVTLFGRIRLEYGELLNESLLHLLENFSCPEDPTNLGNPNLSVSFNELLANPVVGQLWYNSSNLGSLYYWDGNNWIPIRSLDDVAANWGSIAHGQQLPRPVSPTTGYVFPYDECIWSVSEGAFDGPFDLVNCTTDDTDSTVTMHYSLQGSSDIIEGLANYLIIGIRNATIIPGPPPTPSITPTISGPPVTPGVTPTPTPTPSMGSGDIIGELVISPSTCDPGTPGPGGTETTIHDTCGIISKAAFDKSLYISINISGGIGPFTVDFSNIIAETIENHPHPDQLNDGHLMQYDINDPNWICGPSVLPTDAGFYSCFPDQASGNPTAIIQRSYGGEGTPIGGNKFVINSSSGGLAYARYRHISPHFYTGFNWVAAIKVSGHIIVTDNNLNTKNWYVPRFTGEDSTDLSGCRTNINSPYPLPNGYGPIYWIHWGVPYGPDSCDNCENCIT